jgi:chromosome segregation ATPase
MAVPRSRWTDERLDQLAERVMRQDVLEARFDGLDRRMDNLERRFSEFQLEMRELRADVNALRGELYATKRWMMGLWLSGAFGFAALFVQIALQN